ncbi:MAG TPA: Hpt domain-containing protein, partial [Bacillota bacterium]|nr:Hpt domain-containing protein [Bacillota bacterium]
MIGREPMVDMYVFETFQLIEQLEQILLNGEKDQGLEASIGEIFRIMHTIKGSSAMMMFNNITDLAHAMEDLFYFLREEKPNEVDYSVLVDAVLEGVDFVKSEVEKVENGREVDGDAGTLIQLMKERLNELKTANPSIRKENPPAPTDPKEQKFYISFEKKGKGASGSLYQAVVFFTADCQLENIRAFSLVHNLKEIGDVLECLPENIVDDVSAETIRNEGLQVVFSTEQPENEIRAFFEGTPFLRTYALEPILAEEAKAFQTSPQKPETLTVEEKPIEKPGAKEAEKENVNSAGTQSFISVNIKKLDQLMDLVGELVIAEAMVTRNPDLADLQLDNFQKAARQLRKITGEL